jgi:hypothetical protein
MKTVKLPLQKAYPRKIYFSNTIYRIIYKKDIEHFGETDPVRKTITIKDGLSPRQLLATLVHELLHVIEFEHPVKVKHKTVYKLEQAIVEILLDNFL